MPPAHSGPPGQEQGGNRGARGPPLAARFRDDAMQSARIAPARAMPWAKSPRSRTAQFASSRAPVTPARGISPAPRAGAWISQGRCDVGPVLPLKDHGPGMRPTVETDMFRPIGIRRPFALAAVLALLLPAVAFAQCEIIGDANLCNGAVQLCGPEGLYEYMWIDPAGQFLFDRCIMATTAGT